LTDWIEALSELTASGQAAVLITVLRAEGSTPREAGAKMVVGSQAQRGTIGGGNLELQAIAAARDRLASLEDGKAPAPFSRDFALGPSLGQCCGGAVTLLFEVVLPPRWRVAVFGAGHVGRALVKLFAELPCLVDWIDSRETEFPAAVPENVRPLSSPAPAAEVADLPSGCDVLVMTHSHALDLEIVEAALRRQDIPYLGLIGSRTKRARFESRLSERGFSAADLGRLVCPIGIPGASGKLPAEIAIAVVAQILQRRSGGRGAGQ